MVKEGQFSIKALTECEARIIMALYESEYASTINQIFVRMVISAISGDFRNPTRMDLSKLKMKFKPLRTFAETSEAAAKLREPPYNYDIPAYTRIVRHLNLLKGEGFVEVRKLVDGSQVWFLTKPVIDEINKDIQKRNQTVSRPLL
jgi:hypothetical protein